MGTVAVLNYREGREGGCLTGKAGNAGRGDGRGSQPPGRAEGCVVGVHFVHFCAAWFSRTQFSVFT